MNYIAKSEKSTTIKLVYMSMFIAISFIGSFIKIQGTIALDSMSAFFASLFLGPVLGGLVGALGHGLTAFTSGFPLTVPIHIIIMLEMGAVAYLFGVLYKKSNPIFANVAAIILNGIGAVLLLAPITKLLGLPLNGRAFIYAMTIPLTLASALNIGLASILFEKIKGV